ncbi:MAG: acetoin utilization protein AcuC [Infirmifilum sp.]|uniref:acetoin utilization protein AcuC n=1 Tax=Infirmifilum TaxID=2856573 RepID=UPI000A6E3560|nr:acetoin utilization protein AcuC [Infirmifilum uzonense]
MREVYVAYSEELTRISFTPASLRENWTRRIRLFYEEFLPRLERRLPVSRVPVEPATEKELLLAHDPEYVDFVKQKSREGRGLLDYGDTPAYPQVFEAALKAVGSTLTLARLLREKPGIGFTPNGGFHHARRRAAGGFCVFNDLAVAALWLRSQGVGRIAIVDIDAHHGDGTQQILYSEDVLKISVHGYGYGFYPGTGWIDELGDGQGLCKNINIPVPLGSGDDVFKLALEEIIVPQLEHYKPEFLIIQAGVDGHDGDPLTDLRFTENSYIRFAESISSIARNIPVLVTGGGGYVPETVARIWALELALMAGGDAREFTVGEVESSSSMAAVNALRDRLNWLKNKLEECSH